MSEHFAQMKMHFPSTEAMKAAAEERMLNGIEFFMARSERGEVIPFDQAFAGGWALGVPNVAGKDFQTVLVQCLVNELASTVIRMSRSEDPATKKTENGLHIDMQILIQDLAVVLRHLVNSTSMEKGTFEDYDRDEICSRLRRAVSRLSTPGSCDE